MLGVYILSHAVLTRTTSVLPAKSSQTSHTIMLSRPITSVSPAGPGSSVSPQHPERAPQLSSTPKAHWVPGVPAPRSIFISWWFNTELPPDHEIVLPDPSLPPPRLQWAALCQRAVSHRRTVSIIWNQLVTPNGSLDFFWHVLCVLPLQRVTLKDSPPEADLQSLGLPSRPASEACTVVRVSPPLGPHCDQRLQYLNVSLFSPRTFWVCPEFLLQTWTMLCFEEPNSLWWRTAREARAGSPEE